MIYRVILVIGLALMAWACVSPVNETQNWWKRDGKVKVLSTIAMIHDLVQQVGGDHVDSMVMIKGELDPHSYQLVKGDDEKLAYADLIFYNGLGLEHGPSLHRTLDSQPKAIALGNRLLEENPALIITCEGHPDPHIWMDVSLWAKTVPYIVEALSQKDPAHADDYQNNGKKITALLMQAHEHIAKKIKRIPVSRRYLVTSHDAFNYFTRAYLAESDETQEEWEKRFASPEGIAPESQLSVTDIQAIIDHLQKYQIRVLFPESNISKDSIKKILRAGREKGLELVIADVALYADAMGKPGSGGDTYLKMMQHDAAIISHYLEGQHE